MITGYHRPNNLAEALTLISRDTPTTYWMGGGTKINRASSENFEVIDLQALALQPELGLRQLGIKGNSIVIGGAVTLQNLENSLVFPPSIRASLGKALSSELNYNLRQSATVGGTMAKATSRSSFSAVLLAMDAMLDLIKLDGEPAEASLGEYFALRVTSFPRALICRVRFQTSLIAVHEAVARTPMDFPIVSASVARWHSGRTRVVLGGYGETPVLVLDGPDSSGAETAAREKYLAAGDEWASADYRSEVAGVLVKRNIKILEEILDE